MNQAISVGLSGIHSSSVSRTGYSLSVWAVALLPYFILAAGDNSFTFQSTYFCLALMVLSALFSREKVAYSRYVVTLVVGFVAIMGVGNLVTLVVAPEMVTDKTLIRALMFLAIIWFFAHAVSREWNAREIVFMLRSVALSMLASALLELMTWFSSGFYEGRVYPESLTGHVIDANFFALLLVVQVSCAFLLAIFSRSLRSKILYFVLMTLGLASVMLTGSRSGLLCIALVVVLGYVAFLCSERRGKLPTTLFFVALVTVALVLVNQYMGDWMFERFFRSSYNDGSNQFRVELWAKAVQRWMTRPLFGFGVGNYNYYASGDWGEDVTAVTTHGTMTDFLVDFGALGFFLFLSMVLRIFERLLATHSYTLLALCPGICVCWIIVGAERTVALWLFLIVFTVTADYLFKHRDQSIGSVIASFGLEP